MKNTSFDIIIFHLCKQKGSLLLLFQNDNRYPLSSGHRLPLHFRMKSVLTDCVIIAYRSPAWWQNVLFLLYDKRADFTSCPIRFHVWNQWICDILYKKTGDFYYAAKLFYMRTHGLVPWNSFYLHWQLQPAWPAPDRADFRLDVSHLRHGMYHQTAVQIL